MAIDSFFFFYSAPPPVQAEEVVPPAVVETERPRSFSSQNLNVEDIDTESNPQLVAVYVKDIYKYLNDLEVCIVALMVANYLVCCSNILVFLEPNTHQTELYGRI